MFVMICEFSAESTTVYGFCPPVIVKPHSSHVDRVSVTFGCMVAILDVSVEDGRHDVSLPAGGRVSGCGGRETSHEPTTLYNGASMPPIPLEVVFESITVIIRLEPIIDLQKFMCLAGLDVPRLCVFCHDRLEVSEPRFVVVGTPPASMAII